LNVILNKKITGAQIAEADDDYICYAFGINDATVRQKLLLELKWVKKPTSTRENLWAFGNNAFGQCGHHHKSINIMQVNLPVFTDSYDRIERVICGRRHSIIVSQMGEIFMAGGIIAPKVVKTKPKKKPEKKDLKKNPGLRKGHEKEEAELAEKEEEKKSKAKDHRWINITSYMKKFRGYGTEFVDATLGINHFAFLSNLYPEDDQPEEEEEESKEAQREEKSRQEKNSNKKFKGADHILDRVLWDPELNADEFIIGYEDRFVGILEIEATQFKGTSIPIHRIWYFKQNEKIVWDRKKKLNLLP